MGSIIVRRRNINSPAFVETGKQGGQYAFACKTFVNYLQNRILDIEFSFNFILK